MLRIPLQRVCHTQLFGIQALTQRAAWALGLERERQLAHQVRRLAEPSAGRRAPSASVADAERKTAFDSARLVLALAPHPDVVGRPPKGKVERADGLGTARRLELGGAIIEVAWPLTIDESQVWLSSMRAISAPQRGFTHRTRVLVLSRRAEGSSPPGP